MNEVEAVRTRPALVGGVEDVMGELQAIRSGTSVRVTVIRIAVGVCRRWRGVYRQDLLMTKETESRRAGHASELSTIVNGGVEREKSEAVAFALMALEPSESAPLKILKSPKRLRILV